MPSSIASTRSRATGCSTTPNSPLARREVALPQLVPARAGQRRIEHLAHLGPRAQPRARCAVALAWWRASRTASVRSRAGRGSSRRCDAVTPMSVHSRCSGADASPRCRRSRRAARRNGRRCTWSPRAPTRRRRGRTRESRAASPTCCPASTSAPCACATAAIAGTSCTSNVSEPGDSANTMRVLGRIIALDAGAGERIVVARPRRRSASGGSSQKRRVGP